MQKFFTLAKSVFQHQIKFLFKNDLTTNPSKNLISLDNVVSETNFLIRSTVRIKRNFFILTLLLTNIIGAQTCPSITVVRQPTSFDAWTGY